MKLYLFFLSFFLLGYNKPISAQQPTVFYGTKNLKFLEKYELVGDTLTVTQTFLDPPHSFRGQQKELLVKKETDGKFETLYLKLLSGLDVAPGDYSMLLLNRTQHDIIGVLPWFSYKTLELCEYAFVPQPSAMVYFDCYPKPSFDSLNKLPSFTDAGQAEAIAVFDDLEKKLERFKNEDPNLKNYALVANGNFFIQCIASHGFNPFIGEKAMDAVMVKYHIKL